MKFLGMSWPLVGLLIILAFVGGCGSSASGDSPTSTASSEEDGSPLILSAEDAVALLRELPYHYRFRRVELPEGASDAVAGMATGRHKTVVHFGVAFGQEAEPVPVPQSGTRNPYDFSQGGGFVFTEDIIVSGRVGKQIHTAAQWDEANRMVVAMEEKLCKATTGKPCPI